MIRNRNKQHKAQAALIDITDLRVRFSEVDSMKVVWHGEYVRYFEDGRESFGRRYAGLGYMDFYNNGYTAPIVDLQLQYKLPLSIGDTATVETRYIPTEAAKICFEYVVRLADGRIAAEGSSMQVFVDADGQLSLVNPDFYNDWKNRWLTK